VRGLTLGGFGGTPCFDTRGGLAWTTGGGFGLSGVTDLVRGRILASILSIGDGLVDFLTAVVDTICNEK